MVKREPARAAPPHYVAIRDSDDDDPMPFILLANVRKFARLPGSAGWRFFLSRREAWAAVQAIPLGTWLTFPGQGGVRVLSTKTVGIE